MYYAAIKKSDIANGEGVRTTLFVSGCRNRCEGCFQPQTWAFDYGQPFTAETEAQIVEMLAPDYINGLTLLGGEPFEPENQPALVELLRQIKAAYPDKSVWAYSGYLFDRDLLSGRLGDPSVTREFLGYLDVLVDGPFVLEQKNLSLRFRGSSNQRLIHVPSSLERGEVVLWEDWQGQGKGLKV